MKLLYYYTDDGSITQVVDFDYDTIDDTLDDTLNDTPDPTPIPTDTLLPIIQYIVGDGKLSTVSNNTLRLINIVARERLNTRHTLRVLTKMDVSLLRAKYPWHNTRESKRVVEWLLTGRTIKEITTKSVLLLWVYYPFLLNDDYKTSMELAETLNISRGGLSKQIAKIETFFNCSSGKRNIKNPRKTTIGGLAMRPLHY